MLPLGVMSQVKLEKKMIGGTSVMRGKMVYFWSHQPQGHGGKVFNGISQDESIYIQPRIGGRYLFDEIFMMDFILAPMISLGRENWYKNPVESSLSGSIRLLKPLENVERSFNLGPMLSTGSVVNLGFENYSMYAGVGCFFEVKKLQFYLSKRRHFIPAYSANGWGETESSHSLGFVCSF